MCLYTDNIATQNFVTSIIILSRATCNSFVAYGCFFLASQLTIVSLDSYIICTVTTHCMNTYMDAHTS